MNLLMTSPAAERSAYINDTPAIDQEGSKPSALVWVVSPNSLAAHGLKAALENRARVCLSRKAPVGLDPSLVTVLANTQDEISSEVKRARELAPFAPVVVFAFSADLALARAAIRSGARGFIHAGMPPEQIVRALSVVQKGEVAVPRELVSGLLLAQENGAAEPLLLTPRQEEILELVSEGLTNAQVAKKLFLSEFTIKQHLRAAYKTLGAKNRSQAARIFRELRRS